MIFPTSLFITYLISLDAAIEAAVYHEGFVLSVRSRRSNSMQRHVKSTELVDDINEHDDDENWLPDRDQIKSKKKLNSEVRRNSDPEVGSYSQPTMRQTYTPEEEEIIQSLGGKGKDRKASKREPGFLGDCTIKEIAHDFQVPIPYLADVLCTWGVPPPIDCRIPIGDMITGEHCFAILEAIHTLDIGALHDRYSNYDMVGICEEYDIDLKDAFQLAIKENWNLPFGVQTHLRVEQEEQLLQELVPDGYNY